VSRCAANARVSGWSVDHDPYVSTVQLAPRHQRWAFGRPPRRVRRSRGLNDVATALARDSPQASRERKRGRYGFQLSSSCYVAPTNVATIYAGLGELDQAIDCFNGAFRKRRERSHSVCQSSHRPRDPRPKVVDRLGSDSDGTGTRRRNWRTAVVLVQPETGVRWHRNGLRADGPNMPFVERFVARGAT
jgi:hypothetical protein